MENLKMQQNQEFKQVDDGEELKKTLSSYFKYWRYFILSVIVFLVLAFLYVRYSSEIYATTAKIKILDDKESGMDLSGLNGVTTLFSYSKLNLENEAEIIKSRRLLGQVARDLKLETVYFKEGSVKDKLLYNSQSPFLIQWISKDTISENTEFFNLTYTEKNQFSIYEDEVGELGNFTYLDTIKGEKAHFTITPNLDYVKNTSDSEESYLFYFVTEDNLIDGLSKNLSIEPYGENSDILKANFNGSNILKNEKIVNNLINQFNQDGIEDKRLVSKRTGEFVENRLVGLEKELDTVETDIVDFKESSDLIDLEANAKQLFGKETTAEAERFKVETQIAVANDFKEELLSQNEFELLPANIGIESDAVNKQTEDFNRLILDRNRLLISSTEENPIVLRITEKLRQLKKNILKSVDGYLSNLEISIDNLNNREGGYTNEIGALPEKEKIIRSKLRQQSIKEKLYLFLLQKREEAALSFAITAPTIKIVDYAYTDEKKPISPQKKIIFLAAILVGLFFPFSIIYIKNILSTSLKSWEELEGSLNNINVLGEVPQLKQGQSKLIKKNDQSVIAEAFRIIRTNLTHYSKLESLENNLGKVIYVTSSVKGEGKTFTAINLSRALALTGKKVLLIGCDLRNPQIHNYFNVDRNSKGVADYLYNPKIELDSIIVRNSSFEDDNSVENVDFILSGSLPPNAAELLMSQRFKLMIEECKQAYDYIIVDTAPTIYVTDTFLISQEADATIYMVRQGVTQRKLINYINGLNNMQKLKNISVVLNGVKNDTNHGYGYGYAYTEENNKNPFWKIW